MVDFNSLLSKKAFEAPPPAQFPEGEYTGVVKQVKQATRGQGDKAKPVISVEIRATAWPEDLDEEAKGGKKLEGKLFTRDYFLNGEEIASGNLESFYYVDQLLRSCGVKGEGLSYAEALPNLVGAEVKFVLSKRTYERDGKAVETTDVKNVIGTAGD